MFSTACDSASITSTVSKWRPFSFMFNRGNRKVWFVRCHEIYVVFGKKIPWWKRKCETVRCRDATASSFVAKVRSEVFAHFNAVAEKLQNSVQNWLFGLIGLIPSEQSPTKEK
jgi:hypothetical protein